MVLELYISCFKCYICIYYYFLNIMRYALKMYWSNAMFIINMFSLYHWYIYIVKMVSWSWRYGYDLGKFCLRRYVLNRTIVTPLVFLRSLPRMYLLGHWVLFIYWQFCFLLCLVIKVFLDSDLLSIEDQELFI